MRKYPYRIIKVSNIRWDLSGDDMSEEEKAEVLNRLPKENEFELCPYDQIHYGINPDTPDEEIVQVAELLDDISDQLTDMSGFCHDGFSAECYSVKAS